MNILSICILHVYRIHIDEILNSIMTEAKSEVRSQSCKKTSNETVLSLARLSLSVADLVSGKVVNYYISYVPSKECKSEASPQIMPFVYQRVPRQTFAISYRSKSFLQICIILDYTFILKKCWATLKIFLSGLIAERNKRCEKGWRRSRE